MIPVNRPGRPPGEPAAAGTIRGPGQFWPPAVLEGSAAM